MSAWGACSLIQIVPTTQSWQTADFQAHVKQDYSVGISAHLIQLISVSGDRRQL